MMSLGFLSVAPISSADAQEPVLETYSAGQQIGVEVVLSGDPVLTTENTLVAVPGATLSWTSRDSVLIEVDFSAECRLIGGAGPSAWVEVFANIETDIPLDGFPKVLEPGAGVGTPMAFCSDDVWAMHSASWATLVPKVTGPGGPATYTVQLYWRANAAGDTAWLDDWKMSLRVSKKPD